MPHRAVWRWLPLIVLLVGVLAPPPPVLAAGNAGVKVSKTVDSTSITAALSLTLAVDRPAAIPGDTLTYSGQVSNTGSTLGIAGQFTAESHASTASTIVSYFDEVEVCSSVCSSSTPVWTPLAAFAAVQPGYTPVEPVPTVAGLALTATPVPASGVTYPGAGGDQLLGTQIGPAAVGRWTYRAAIALTPAQIATLSDPNQVQGIRNTIHMEVTPRNEAAAEPWSDSEVFGNPFQAQANPAAISSVVVSVTASGGQVLTVDAGTVPALALLKPGDTAAYAAHFQVPVPAVKGAGETDAAYLARLTALEGSSLPATAAAQGTGPQGPVSAPAPPAVATTEHLPIVSIAKSGPPTVDAGTTETNPLGLANAGGATAAGLAITDGLPGGATGTVSGVPASLAPGASGTATASYAVPGSQPAGSLADTAAVTWQDANGNAYGPVSSSFTTTVRNPLFGATLTLAPASAGPDVLGQSQQLTATLVDRTGNPIPNQGVTFSVTGANPTTATATTDAGGKATFSYVGTSAGTDQAQATASAPGVSLQSNTASVSWIKPIQTVSMTPVQGNFFHEPSTATSFVAQPGQAPDFSQTFPTIDFNPPPGTVPHSIANVSNLTRPFTDLTTDVDGNFTGTIVAQGNGLQAGLGTMSSFDVEFTGTLVAAQAGDVTFDLQVGDGFILGVGGGATRVSGDLTNPPASNTSVFQGYGLIAAYQAQSAAATRTATVHFPAPGSYPFEIDYFDCCDGDLSLTMTAAAIVPQTSPLSIYVGYADGLRPGGAAFPFPWIGSPNTTFVGDTTHVFDSGALRFDNSSAAAITLDSVTVDVGSNHFDLWPHGLTIPAQQTLVLAQTNNQNFDTSDFPIQCSANNGVIPAVNVTVAGVLTSYQDTHQVLNTGGIDPGGCGRNESTAWQRIAGVSAAINVPLPPAVSLDLTPYSVPGATVGLTQKLTATAMDGQGLPVANLPLTVQVFGVNAQQLSATTDAGGVATFAYTGANQGTDQVQVSAFVTGLRTISNLASVTWTNPLQPGPNPQPSGGPPPSVTNASPADGSIVTRPIPVSATITPPAGQTISSWQVTYQAQDPGPVVTLASGTGTPPSPLATFDPTQLPNDSYQIAITAVASNGVTETLTTTVTVLGNLKLGRYISTYQDLNVPVNGFQMQVRRTYDSTVKTQGDFGIGWRVDVVNFRTAPNRQLGAGGWSMFDTSCFVGICTTAFKSSAPHYVSVTFPDQHVEVFDFTPQGGTNVFWTATAAFTARSGTGTTSKLEPLGGGALTYRGDGNLYDASGNVYDPQQFRLTTLDGRVLILDRTTGLVSETDRAGNSLTVDSAGVHASGGQSVTFTRDAAGRITQVTGPSGQRLQYAYSAAGDLASSTDPNGNQTTYAYDGSHDLLSAAGPGGRPLQSEQFDAGGRLIAVTDGAGNTAQVHNDVAGQQATIVDPAGRLTTVLTFDDRGDVVREDRVFDGQTLTTTLTYDPVGRPLTRTDPLGHKWSASYDASGNVLGLGTPLGHASAMTYDSFGLPLTFTDPVGSTTGFGYDAAGNLVSITNAAGQSTRLGYDSHGNVTSRTDARGQISTYTYDGAGNATAVTDPAGDVSHAAFDGSGRLTDLTDGAGGHTAYAYDANGKVISIRNAVGGTTTYAYDALNRQVSRTDPLGQTTAYGYDGAGRLTSVTDPLGHTTSYAYDADGRVVSETDGAGDVTAYAYDGAGRLASETDPLGRVTAYGYDGAGRLASERLPNGGVVQLGYDGDGRLTSTTDPLGRVSSAAYDAAGNLVAQTDPLGNTTSYTPDALGRAIKVVDPLGQVTGRTYDATGGLASVTDPAGGTTTYTYDAAGRLATVSDPLGHVTGYGYDAAGRRVAVTDPLGRTTRFQYDALGHETATVLPSGITTSYGFDPLGRETSETDGLGNRTTNAYDAAGNLTATTDPNGHTTGYGYDAANRLTSITDAAGGTVALAYDAAGQLVSTRNPRGDTTLFGYDPAGNLASRSDPGGAVTSATYDAAGQLVSTTDPRGIAVSRTYDAAGNPASISFPGGSVRFAYDADHRRTSMTDPTGTTTYGYDAASRLTSVAAPEGTVSYGYDAAGRRTSLGLPGGRGVGYTYDAAGELTGLSDWLGGAFGMAYNADGRPTMSTRPNGVTTTYGYDGAGRLVGVGHAAPSGPIANFSYTYDAAGNRVGVSGSAGSETYTLDALNRIVGATYPNGDVVSYAYDAAGNRTSSTRNGVTTTYTYDAAGRLTSAGGTGYAYDAAGNLVSAGADQFAWDWNGRLVSAAVGGATSSYTYDGDGFRVATSTGTGTSSALWDRTDPGQLLDDGSQAYVQAGGGVQEEVPAAGGPGFPLADALGSVRSLTGPSGAVTGSSNYDVFGSVRSHTGASSPFGFAGALTDPTGLLMLGARQLDTGLGRFLSPDSVQPNAPGTQGYNRYAYVAGNPTTMTDPSGAMAVDTAEQDVVEVPVTTAAATAEAAAVGITLADALYWLVLVPAAGAAGAAAGEADCLLNLPPCSWAVAAVRTATATSTATAPAAGPVPPPGPSGSPGTGTGIGINPQQEAAKLRIQLDQCRATGLQFFQYRAADPDPSRRCRLGENIYMPADDEPNTTQGIIDALIQNPPWVYLNHRTNPDTTTNRKWYTLVAYSAPCPSPHPGQVCDEYPFFTTAQGGPEDPANPAAHPRAHLKLVPAPEQYGVQGPTLQSFYGDCSVTTTAGSNDDFFVITEPSWPLTAWLCRNWGTAPPGGIGPTP